MAQPGRKSAASLSVAGVVTTISRVAPPQALTDRQRGIWLATVNSKPAEWFGDEHVPMLVEYVRHIETADLLTQQIEEFDPEWLKDDDGLKRLDRLTGMRAREAGLINTLARSMRLTQQAVYRADKAATLGDKGKGRKPWQTVEG
jgi:hypothetical protein